MHRLRIELRGKSDHFVTRQAAWPVLEDAARLEVFPMEARHRLANPKGYAWLKTAATPPSTACVAITARIGHDCSFLLRSFRLRFAREEPDMFSFTDLFQWERFVTPSIIKLFFWLAIILVLLGGLSGIGSALGAMMVSPGVGVIMMLVSLLGIVIGVILARIVAEFVLIVFRINEHLGAIRSRGEM
jgi:hypothetical protein